MKTRFFLLFIFMLLSHLVAIANVTANKDLRSQLNLQAANGTTGNIEGLVVLISFADRSPYFTPAEVDSFFNQVGYSKYHNNGSVRDYWAAVSQNRVQVHTNVTKAYYKAPKFFSYYDTEGGGHTHELLDSALNWLDGTGFDFSKLTVDGNRNIKSLSFQFVGNSGASGLWGHSSYHGRTFDGVHTASYQISELGTSEMHLGGICHEQGHMLFGWPDTYDTNGENGGSSGCGKFDLMAAGNSDNSGAPSGNPMPPNPYFRYLSGWNDMIPLNSLPNNSTLNIIANSWNTYVYRNPDKPGEMFIVEARKKPYRNVDMPGEGILVWHIDSIISGNTNQQRTETLHYKVSVVQADNAWHLESGANIGEARDYFGSLSTSLLSLFHTKWWDTSYSGLQIRNIGAPADTMTVLYGSDKASDIGVKTYKTKGGTVSPLGLRYFRVNTNQTFTATPSANFEIDDCIVDGVSQGALSKYTLTNLTEPHTLTFAFAHKAVALKDVVSGIKYSYYEGSWSSLPDFSKLTPKSTGSVNYISIGIPNRAADNFGIHYSGYIKVPADAEYTFYLVSDDGSRFSIDGLEIVANQCDPETQGKIRLRAGYHPFTFDFFEGQVTESVLFRWSSPTMSKRNVTGVLFSGTPDLNASLDDAETIGQAQVVSTAGEFIITCPTNQVEVEVYNLSGLLVAKRQFESTNGTVRMSNETLASGLYLVRVKSGGRVLCREKVNVIR